MNLIAIYTTTRTRDEAHHIANTLVERQLVACAQIDTIESVYTWNGAIQHDPEYRLMLKTTTNHYAAVETAIRELHSYELPAIYAVAVEQAYAPYAAWVAASTSDEIPLSASSIKQEHGEFMIEISSLTLYPVKSLQGIALQQATLTTQGLAFDRQWMVTDAHGHFVTQRQLPNMAQIRVHLTADALVLEHDSLPPLTIALHPKPAQRVEVVVWRDRCQADDEGDAASQWLTQILGQWQGGDLRLVRFADNFTRPVDPNYMNGDTADTAFSDGYPFLIVSEASLQALNTQLEANGASPVPMTRFRPNIVISGIAAFGEDRCATLTATTQAYRFAIRKPCQRCKTTTVDQQTGIISNPKEPLKTLTAMNPYPHLTGAFFGQNATLTVGDKQVIKVGDVLLR